MLCSCLPTPQTKVEVLTWETTRQRALVGIRKPVAHKLSRTKSGSSGAQEVRATVLGPDHFGSHGQHNDVSYINKEGV